MEKIDDNKINRFGEARLRSPGPPIPPPPALQSPGLVMNPKLNGVAASSNGKVPGSPTLGEVDFLDMLEKEEADFADQVRKQKSFLQKIFRDKEELAQMCVNQSNKLSKLENERMEWQRKIIETERERRNFQERLDQEQQAHRQSVKKFEKLKRDSDKSVLRPGRADQGEE